MKLPTWQLHRGYWLGGCRENSMEAFEAAAESGCSMIEFDVQLSKSKVPHAFHDATLLRIFGINEKFVGQSDSTLRELGVPTLKAILQSKKLPEFLNIELKIASVFCRSLARAVAKDIKRYGHAKAVLVSSFNPVSLLWCRWYCPNISRALIIGDPKVVLGWKLRLALFLSQPEYLNVHADLFEKKETRQILLATRRKIAVWTVNESQQAGRLLTLGATSIISDSLPSRT